MNIPVFSQLYLKQNKAKNQQEYRSRICYILFTLLDVYCA